ncbi:MAG: agmatinase [Nitrospirota bacterium]|nr:agmatinase [Nitrospirota bacterium]
MALPSGWLGQADNFLGIDEPWCHPDQAGVYVLPAPYEHTSSYILGSDRGPSAIIEASQQVELYDETLRYEPYREWGGVATAATLNLDGRVDGPAVQAIQDFVQPHVGRGKFLVTLTGEHTGALGAIRAHARNYPGMCVVQIDAHGDLRQAYQDNPYSHASVMARVVEDGLPLVQIGVRSIVRKKSISFRRPHGSIHFLPPRFSIHPVPMRGGPLVGFPRFWPPAPGRCTSPSIATGSMRRSCRHWERPSRAGWVGTTPSRW